jgi:alpha-1,6-mannosyltransferase
MSQHNSHPPFKIIISTILLLSGIIYTVAVPSQNEFYKIITCFTVAFIGLAGLFYFSEKISRWTMAIVGIAIVVPLFYFPNLSDDIYRFYWDGVLVNNGISPYRFLPSQLMSTELLPVNLKEVFGSLNSPEYFSIYPPVNQLFFWMASFGRSLAVFATLLKIQYLIFHLWAWYGWNKYVSNNRYALLYFANPLVIVEGIGNLHVELVMVAFLIWTYIFFIKNRPVMTGLLLALGVGVKLLPLMLLPYLFFHYKKNKSLFPFISSFMGFSFLFFSPLLIGLDIENLFKSIDLYFRKFEFNASIYYLQRWVGYQVSGYNLIAYIGPLNGLITLSVIVYYSKKWAYEHSDSFMKVGYLAFMVYLLLSTTVHPWYIMTPLLFGVGLRIWHVVAWSFLGLLSYVNYNGDVYQEQHWMIWLEYGLVLGIFLMEIKMKNTLYSK